MHRTSMNLWFVLLVERTNTVVVFLAHCAGSQSASELGAMGQGEMAWSSSSVLMFSSAYLLKDTTWCEVSIGEWCCGCLLGCLPSAVKDSTANPHQALTVTVMLFLWAPTGPQHQWLNQQSGLGRPQQRLCLGGESKI